MTRRAQEVAAVDAGYTRDDVLTVTRRREAVTVTMVERVCSGCGRRGLDVRAPWRGEGAMCAAGVGCQGIADRAAKRMAGVR